MKRQFSFFCALVFFSFFACELIAIKPVVAATCTVTTNSDSGAGSLRECIANATNGDTVVIPEGIGTITLAAVIEIDKILIISGAGSANTIIDGGNASRIFLIGNSLPAYVQMSGVTLQHGLVASDNCGGAILLSLGSALALENSTITQNSAASGGGICTSGFLALINVTVTNNMANMIAGGGIFILSGATSINNSLIAGNSTTGTAGGVYNNGALSIDHTTISNNDAGATAGGVNVDGGTASIMNSTISNNTALLDGGGVYVDEQAILSNVTIFGNSAGRNGGGIYLSNGFFLNHTLSLNNATIASNVADSDKDNIGVGGGIYTADAVRFSNTLIANNLQGTVNNDCNNVSGGGIMQSAGNNLIRMLDPATCVITGETSTNIIGENPLLDPNGLQPNESSGPQTVALLSDSPAINAGSLLTATSTDERGVSRPQGSAPDIGAFEYVFPLPAPLLGGGCSVSASEKNIATSLIILLILPSLMLGMRLKKYKSLKLKD